ncbi:MAG: LysM peptidoglycan-binding domain-containing protein [Oscillospiraceae bacterium]|jgi:nucleoid-associated protein YgaU|nr:LysM peptidoglycan-binding domain-containing protein [Oscillospiraceae bacterium]
METATILALDQNENETSRIDFDFNPSDFSVNYAPQYTKKKGVAKQQDNTEFIGEGTSAMSVSMTLDSLIRSGYDEAKAEDVSGKIAQLRALVQVSAELHKPPSCRFEWGSTKYTGHITSLSVNFTMFTSEGKPVRATVNLSIQGKKSAAVGLESPDRTKRRVLSQDLSLCLIAYEAYNDCGEWRRLAAANGIRNPRRVQAGTVLRIPPIERV